MDTPLKYLSTEKDRHGKSRLYVRRGGRRIWIREDIGTPEFARAYADAVEALGARIAVKTAAATPQPHPKGSVGWLGALYFRSKGDFLSLAKDSQRARRNDLEACFAMPLEDKAPQPVMGGCPLKYLTAQKIKRMIEAKDGHGARANRRKHLSALCAWGVDNGHLPSNPVRDIKSGTGTRRKGGGYYTWTVQDVQQFLAHWGPGTKPRLAMALLLFTGARRQDMVTLGRQHVKGEWLQYVPKKTLRVRNEASQKPLLPVLAEIIKTSPCGPLTFLETAYGKPFTPAGFGNWFRDRCDEAGLPMCTAHGLKKAGATIAAENGATTHQLMAMFDWDTVAMAEVYTRAAEKKRLAGEAMFLISLERTGHVDCRTMPNSSVAPIEIAAKK